VAKCYGLVSRVGGNRWPNVMALYNEWEVTGGQMLWTCITSGR
jgi:hypothetical protein